MSQNFRNSFFQTFIDDLFVCMYDWQAMDASYQLDVKYMSECASAGTSLRVARPVGSTTHQHVYQGS